MASPPTTSHLTEPVKPARSASVSFRPFASLNTTRETSVSCLAAPGFAGGFPVEQDDSETAIATSHTAVVLHTRLVSIESSFLLTDGREARSPPFRSAAGRA